MVNTRFIILNAQQISGIIHDYVAENAHELCGDYSLNETGSYIILDKSNVRMLCLFSKSNSLIVNNEDLLNRLPYSGFNNFILTNKQITEIITHNTTLKVEDLNFAPKDKYKKIKRNSIRLMTLNESDLIFMLYKQLLKFIDCDLELESRFFHSGLQVEFNGENSYALFYFGGQCVEYDFEKISKFQCKQDKYWDLKYVDVEDGDLNDYLK